ncbi:MAG: portal protein [Methylococcaceae bacterium]
MNVFAVYTACRTERTAVAPLWNDISKFVGIGVDPDYALYGANSGKKARQVDDFVDDPTSAISVNQAGDYLAGIVWGTGEGIFDLKPSSQVLELVDSEVVDDYFAYATKQTLLHMNHHEAGYSTALRTYMYDQVAFGTSGIGIFPNNGFKDGVDDNALICRQYGVDNVCIDVGKSNLIDYVFATYNWRVSRIIGEFCMVDGVISAEKVATLPKKIRDAYGKNDINQKFDIVFGMMPRTDYNPRLKGKRGTKFRGVWFMADKNVKDNAFFLEEDFNEKPINIARMIVVRGEVWGRSSGTMLLSSIRSVNYMVGTAIEVIEKMADPALGMFSNAIFGDGVLDSSPSGLTVFNSTLAGASGGNPVFPLFDVGNPSALVEFLIPYLNEKITTAFKVDALLDFNSDTDMTATETLKRSVIRGQSLSGILIQQKNERLIPDVRRSVSVLDDLGELGINPTINEARATKLRQAGRIERIIPQAVLDVKATGRSWYEIRFNNELEKIIRTEKVQNLLQILQTILAIMQAQPDIVHAVNWYKLLKDINDNLDANNEILLSETEFKDKMVGIAKQRAEAQTAAMAQSTAETGKTVAQTTQAQKETRNA